MSWQLICALSSVCGFVKLFEINSLIVGTTIMESKIASVLCIFTFILIGFICANDVSSTKADGNGGKDPHFVIRELIKDIELCRGEASNHRYYIKCERNWASSDAAFFQGIVTALYSGKLEYPEDVVLQLERLKKRYRGERPKK
ncbi:uncharacterized protein LOC141858784 [Brevipalpus obovatus]|uniref:uncharacterized protein LOC141858784 n=1 Tax=Brevipalpus obovatus TaxID=246614 RepID=UPI003D9E488E